MFVTPAYGQETAPAAQAGTEGGAQATTEVPAEEHGNFPPFDSHTYPSQIVWLAICFGLFYLFLKRVVIPRIGNILNVRSTRISQDLAQAEKMKNEADAAIAAYEQELAEARVKANAIGQQARDASKAEAETKRKKIEAELEKKLADAEARIGELKAAALREVGPIAESTASAIMERLIGRADKADVAAAVKTAWR
jgi:F-type H+-transporting ATPase subunit b